LWRDLKTRPLDLALLKGNKDGKKAWEGLGGAIRPWLEYKKGMETKVELGEGKADPNLPTVYAVPFGKKLDEKISALPEKNEEGC